MNTQADLHFGTLAVKNGFASSSEIELALEAQKEAPAFENEGPHKLGEILEEMGTLTRAQILAVLETQTRLREAATAAPTPDQLGASSTAIKFEEIEPPALTQESGPPLTVNDEPVTGPRMLKPGDRLQAGELLLRFTGESIELRPKAGAPAPAAAAPAAPKVHVADRLLPVLRTIDGWIARIPPAIHTQRKYVLAGALLGWIALILPWRYAANGATVTGLQGPGWLAALLALVPVGLVLFSRSAEPFTRTERIVCSAVAGLALLVGILKLAVSPSYAVARGIGLTVSILSSASILAAGAFARAGGTGLPADSDAAPTLGARLWKILSRFAGNVSGKGARELSLAMERRDGLLRSIGEAALAAHAELPEAVAAVQAREALQKAEKDAGEPGGASPQIRVKAADAKAKRAFGKLAQRALDGGLPLPGQDAAVAELRAVEARIKELS